jgi:flagellar hook-associated protein 1
MSAGALMNIGIKSLQANYAGLQVTGHNIANANVVGYNRQKIELETSEGQFSGAGFFGKGVDVATVRRVHSEYLYREANVARSSANLDAARLSMLEQMERAFPPGESGTGFAAGQLLNAMVDLASRPADGSTREVVLARAQEMALRMSSAGRQLDNIQRSITQDIRSQVSAINQMAENIAQANDRIAQVAGLGQPPNDLLDERDRLISQLNGMVQVNTVQAADGSISVFLAGGHPLVLGVETQQVSVTQDQDDPTRAALATFDGDNVNILDPNLITGGTLVGLLRFQNRDLVDGRNLLGRLAVAVTGAINAQHVLGVNQYQPFNSSPAQEMFSVGGPKVISNANNIKDGAGNFVGAVSLTITDTAALKPSDYRLVADPSGVPGQWQLTRLVDNFRQTVTSGDIVDGMQINIGPPDPDPRDRFLLQPVGAAASATKLLLTDTRDIAAASPLVATAIPTPNGTVSIDSLKMLRQAPNPDHTVEINFTDDAGNYSWNLLDSAGNVVSSATGQWQPAGTIPTPPDDMNGFELRLLGVPRLGDQIRITPADPANFAQNNGNAISLSALRDALIVDGVTATDAYAAAMADVGVRVQGGRSTAKLTAELADAADAARNQESGVNLDEEAARLIAYQQGYQAAAKVLQTAQTVIDALLNASGG